MLRACCYVLRNPHAYERFRLRAGCTNRGPNWPDLMEQIGLADVTKNEVRQLVFEVGSHDGGDILLPIDGVPKILFVLNENGRGYSVRRVRAVGPAEIKVSKIPLKRGRLGDVKLNFGFGEGKVGDRDALLVLTERDEGGGLLTIRVRPQDPTPDG